MKRKRVVVIKIGGNVINNAATLSALLHDVAKIDGMKVLVHGGGRLLDEFSARLGLAQHMKDGRRITDAETLSLATMVYAGQTNKSIVAQLQALECLAIGLCGADAGLIKAARRPIQNGIDFGFVGDVSRESVNTRVLVSLLETGFVPVFSAITCDASGQLLNTNADTIAFSLATALAGECDVQLHYCFEKRGVLLDLQDEGSLISEINESYYQQLVADQVIASGMLPKLENAFSAIRQGVQTVSIIHPDALLKAIKKNKNAGTYLTA